MPFAQHNFLMDETGAITVDWVVLTAAVVGLALASAAAVRTGTTDLATQINTSLRNAVVASLELPYGFQGLRQALIDNRSAIYATATTENIISWHIGREQAFLNAIAAGHHTPTGNFDNLSAGESLDILFLHRQELLKRGAYPVDGVRDFSELQQIYKDSQ